MLTNKFLYTVLFLAMSATCIVQAQKAKDIKVVVADEIEEGDGAMVRRLFPTKEIKHYDPYVLFDDFSIQPPSGFPDHFHSGFEVITYVVKGKLQHKDSQGNQVVLSAGDVQLFSTGSGIVHSEMPQGTELVRGFQVWINLPREFKTMTPGYEVVKSSEIRATRISDQVTVKTIVAAGTTVRTKAQVMIQEIQIKSGSQYKLVLPEGYNGFVYVVAGSATIEQKLLTIGHAIFFTSQDLEVLANQEVTLLLVSGLPLGEPIRRKGFIVK
jgi:redox-sensitive bicupin YhaK (pirin superfamily)